MKNQEVIYYKIVKIWNELMVSCVVVDVAKIVYSTEEWSITPDFLAKTNRGPLVFDALDNAINFALREYSDYKLGIWECEVRNPHKPIGFCYIDELELGIIRPCSIHTFPRHTVECDSVKLIKRVFEKEPN